MTLYKMALVDGFDPEWEYGIRNGSDSSLVTVGGPLVPQDYHDENTVPAKIFHWGENEPIRMVHGQTRYHFDMYKVPKVVGDCYLVHGLTHYAGPYFVVWDDENRCHLACGSCLWTGKTRHKVARRNMVVDAAFHRCKKVGE